MRTEMFCMLFVVCLSLSEYGMLSRVIGILG